VYTCVLLDFALANLALNGIEIKKLQGKITESVNYISQSDDNTEELTKTLVKFAV
jgi:hypothetical protein